MKRLTSILHIQDMLSEWSGRAISWLILGVMVVLMYEVVARYIFNAPTNWAMESSTMFYGAHATLAGAYTLLWRGHVRMDVAYRLLPRRVQAGIDTFTAPIILTFLGLLLWASIQFTIESWTAREFSGKGTWNPPIYPFKAILTLSVLLLILQSINVFIRNLLILLKLDKKET